jgi:hypothetical protein
LVSYLIDTYGQEQYAELFAEVKSGKRIDAALEAVYGFDQGGLEDEWRLANDLPARATVAPSDDDQQPQVTDAPDNSDAPSAGDGDGTSAATIILIFVVVAVLAGVIAIGAVAVTRRYRR